MNKKLDTIGDILLEEFIKPNGLSVNKVAKACGINQPTLQRIIQGKISLSVVNAYRLAKFFKVSAEFLLGMQTNCELMKVKWEMEKLQ